MKFYDWIGIFGVAMLFTAQSVRTYWIFVYHIDNELARSFGLAGFLIMLIGYFLYLYRKK